MKKKLEEILTLVSTLSTNLDALTTTIQNIQASEMSFEDVHTVLKMVDDNCDNKILEVISNLTIINTPAERIVVETKNDNVPEKVTEPADQKPNPITRLKVKYTDQEIRDICLALIEADFNQNKAVSICKKKGIRCSKTMLYYIRAKQKYTEISDEYFTLKRGKLTAIAKSSAKPVQPEIPVEKLKSTSDGLTRLNPMVFDYIVNQLTVERHSIKRVFKKAIDAGKDVTIFDVFNILYDGKRNKPIRGDDIDVVIRHIAEKESYSIPTITVLMKEKCNIILDGQRLKLIRDLARAAGKECHEMETGSYLVREKKDGDDEDVDHFDDIVVELKRFQMDLKGAWVHYRWTHKTATIFDVYRVKCIVGTPTDTDVQQLVVNLQRNSAKNYGQIADYLHNEFGIVLSKNEVEEYVKKYYDDKYLREQMYRQQQGC